MIILLASLTKMFFVVHFKLLLSSIKRQHSNLTLNIYLTIPLSPCYEPEKMSYMQIVHISDVKKLKNGQNIMTVGWLGNYSPFEGGRATLTSAEQGCKENIKLDLSSCEIVDISDHMLTRVIGKLKNNFVKVQCLKPVSKWQYYNYNEIITNISTFNASGTN